VLLIGIFITKDDLSQQFSSEQWKATWSEYTELKKTEALEKRKHMSAELTKVGILEDKSKQEVLDLLGLEENDLDSNKWNYLVASSDTGDQHLRVEFNDNKVSDFYIKEK
jgi:hypothetical protein